MKRICITSFWMIACCFVFGQEKPTERDSFYALSPAEVKAVRAAERAPVTKTNLSKKEM